MGYLRVRDIKGGCRRQRLQVFTPLSFPGTLVGSGVGTRTGIQLAYAHQRGAWAWGPLPAPCCPLTFCLSLSIAHLEYQPSLGSPLHLLSPRPHRGLLRHCKSQSQPCPICSNPLSGSHAPGTGSKVFASGIQRSLVLSPLPACSPACSAHTQQEPAAPPTPLPGSSTGTLGSWGLCSLAAPSETPALTFHIRIACSFPADPQQVLSPSVTAHTLVIADQWPSLTEHLGYQCCATMHLNAYPP